MDLIKFFLSGITKSYGLPNSYKVKIINFELGGGGGGLHTGMASKPPLVQLAPVHQHHPHHQPPLRICLSPGIQVRLDHLLIN